MINGLENLIQTGFFSSSYTNVSLSLLVGGTGCCWTLVPEHIICTEHCKHKNSLSEKEQKAWKTFKDSRKGNEIKLKGKEGEVWEKQANLVEMKKGVGKRESKKPKNSEIEPQRYTQEGESRVLCPFLGLRAGNESAAEGQEGSTDLLSVFDQFLHSPSIVHSAAVTDPLALQGKPVCSLEVFTISI